MGICSKTYKVCIILWETLLISIFFIQELYFAYLEVIENFRYLEKKDKCVFNGSILYVHKEIYQNFYWIRSPEFITLTFLFSKCVKCLHDKNFNAHSISTVIFYNCVKLVLIKLTLIKDSIKRVILFSSPLKSINFTNFILFVTYLSTEHK